MIRYADGRGVTILTEMQAGGGLTSHEGLDEFATGPS